MSSTKFYKNWKIFACFILAYTNSLDLFHVIPDIYFVFYIYAYLFYRKYPWQLLQLYNICFFMWHSMVLVNNGIMDQFSFTEHYKVGSISKSLWLKCFVYVKGETIRFLNYIFPVWLFKIIQGYFIWVTKLHVDANSDFKSPDAL